MSKKPVTTEELDKLQFGRILHTRPKPDPDHRPKPHVEPIKSHLRRF